MATRELVPARQDAGEMWTERQTAIIKAQIAPGVDDANLEYFAAVCRRTGLDPFTKQIYFIGRNGKEDGRPVKKWSVQTGIDGYRLIAARTGELAGIDDAEYDTEDGKQPAWARVTVWRFVQGQRVPFTAKARMAEYKPAYGGDMWARMPYLMLAKCAEALALRKAFPAELSGVYTGEEMMQAADPLADTTRPAPVAPVRRQPQPTPEPAISFVEAEPMEPLAPAPEPEQDLNGKTTLEDDQQPGNGYAPATKQQRTAIEKLCATLGKAAPGGDMNYTQARLMIAALSKEYNESRRTAGDAVSDAAPPLTIAEFLAKVKAELELNPKQAMERLGVRALSGLNLDAAFAKLRDGLMLPPSAQREYDLESMPMTAAHGSH